MSFSRRSFLSVAGASLATVALPARGLGGLKIGVTDWNLRQTARLEAVGLARRLGFEGVQVSLGRDVQQDKLPLDNPELIAQYLREAKAQNIVLNGTCLDILHTNYLKNDKLGERWVRDGIRLTKALQTKVMLLPFFGRGALETAAEKEYVGDVLRDIGPEAEKAGVILGLENTISAEDNVRIMERSRSKAVLVYYDIGNSDRAGFNVTREIDWLGKKRICQMHFKDNPHYLGEGKIDMAEVLRSVSRIDFEGFANLETDAPSKSIEADMKRNLAFVRKVKAEVQGS
jgi:L-ribulose-5-phosphate 3-epimerase